MVPLFERVVYNIIALEENSNGKFIKVRMETSYLGIAQQKQICKES